MDHNLFQPSRGRHYQWRRFKVTIEPYSEFIFGDGSLMCVYSYFWKNSWTGFKNFLHGKILWKRKKYSQLENSYWFGYLDNIRTAWRPKPKSWWKKVSPYPYVRAAAYIPTFLAFFQFHISDWFRSSSIYDYKRSRSPDIFQIFICHFDVTLYFIHGMNFPYLRIEMILRLQKIIFGPKLEILDFIYLKIFSSD